MLTFTGAEGAVTVTAKSFEKPAISDIARIAVVKHVTNIRTPLSAIYLKRGTSYTLPVLLGDGSQTVSGGFICTSANKKVVTVNGGKLKASDKIRKKTKTSITIKARNGYKKKIIVYVVPKAKAIKSFAVTGLPKTLKKGKTKQLTVKIKTKGATDVKVTYASSKKNIIAVDKAGKLTAIKKGTSEITVKAGAKKIIKKVVVK
jgi:hypothetical protein